jgi:hypothetical protein
MRLRKQAHLSSGGLGHAWKFAVGFRFTSIPVGFGAYSLVLLAVFVRSSVFGSLVYLQTKCLKASVATASTAFRESSVLPFSH